VKIIDRAKFFLKLAQGEWISPSRIETVLEQSPFISQALVMASPNFSACVAVVVPSKLFYEVRGGPEEAPEILKRKMLDEVRYVF
jgi:fatty acid CoA ligase FadD9